MSGRQQRPKGKLCEGLNKVDTHVDHQDRSTAPFGEPALPDALLCHTQLTAVDFLERCIGDLVPLTALTGDAGTGKTTALNAALARRDNAGDRIIRAHNFVAGPLSLHRALTAALGVADARKLSADQLEPALRQALAEAGDAAPPVLVVDNAQSLLPETLRYLSLLAGLRDAGRPLFRILLVGRSGFTARQPMPVQFSLEPIRPDAALQVAERRLTAAGVTLEDETVQGIVHDARGNLRRLNTLLRARIEEGRANGRRRLRSAGSELAARARDMLQARHPRWRDTLAAAAALLAVSAACGFVAYQSAAHQSGAPRRTEEKTVKAAAAAPDAPPAIPAQPAAAVQILPTPSPPPAALPAPSNRLALAEPAPAELRPAEPVPIVAPPAPPAPRAAQPADQSADQPGGGDRPVTASPATMPPQAGRFRVNNISSCHRGLCPRWTVIDLNRQTRFVAAFDPSSLRLDRDTMQRLRQGTLELTVSGSVRKRGQDGQTLVAQALQSMSPHHGQPRQPAVDANDPTPSEDRSPPPGFLPVPIEGPAPAPNVDTEQ